MLFVVMFVLIVSVCPDINLSSAMQPWVHPVMYGWMEYGIPCNRKYILFVVLFILTVSVSPDISMPSAMQYTLSYEIYVICSDVCIDCV